MDLSAVEGFAVEHFHVVGYHGVADCAVEHLRTMFEVSHGKDYVVSGTTVTVAVPVEGFQTCGVAGFSCCLEQGDRAVLFAGFEDGVAEGRDIDNVVVLFDLHVKCCGNDVGE